MNERIQELALAAGKYADETQPRGSYTRDGMWLYAYNEKFAELIVEECTNIGDNYQGILGNEPECFNCRKVAYGIVDKININVVFKDTEIVKYSHFYLWIMLFIFCILWFVGVIVPIVQ